MEVLPDFMGWKIQHWKRRLFSLNVERTSCGAIAFCNINQNDIYIASPFMIIIHVFIDMWRTMGKKSYQLWWWWCKNCYEIHFRLWLRISIYLKKHYLSFQKMFVRMIDNTYKNYKENFRISFYLWRCKYFILLLLTTDAFAPFFENERLKFCHEVSFVLTS